MAQMKLAWLNMHITDYHLELAIDALVEDAATSRTWADELIQQF